MKKKQLASAGRTDIGKVRKRNEDAILLRDDLGLWAVADGLGGHSAGDYASSMIVERLGALTRPADDLDFAELIEDTLCQINVDLSRTASDRSVDLIGSTVVVLIETPAYMLCGWVGDSRVYCFEDGRLRQITRDHAQGAERFPGWSGNPATQPQAGFGALTRAIGTGKDLYIDWVVAPNRPGVQFLLCSDGINKEISDAELDTEFGREHAPQAILDDLFELALSRGGHDNVSAIVLRVGESK